MPTDVILEAGMRWLLGPAGAAVLLLGGCIADQQSRGVTLTAADAAALCRGPDQARCRGAFAQDAAQAGVAETVRLRYAMERVGTGLARDDDPKRVVRCSQTTVAGDLVTVCSAPQRP